ncbi:MAG: 4-hydroxy-tetrahydrodipicolinate synthase [Vampirovibrionales bacterium]
MPLNARLYTALATPFTKEGALDKAAVERLAHYVVEQGSDGLVLMGSTGENPTLTNAEKREVVSVVKAALAGKAVELVVGCSTNNTAETIELVGQTAALGIDGVLVVCPYYNKPSQAGLFAHFDAIAASTDVPIMMYNVPSRTVVAASPETVARLAEKHHHIVGLKQSVPDMDACSHIRRLTPDTFKIWSGDDSLTLPMMALGAYGCVSVAGHLLGAPIKAMIDAAAADDFQTARQRHLACVDLFGELFFLPNPTVLKAVLGQLGVIGPTLRLPLVEPAAEDLGRIKALTKRVQALQAEHQPTTLAS